MAHVISASELKAERKPAIHVNPPVNFFRKDYIEHPSDEDSGENAFNSGEPSDQERWKSIDNVEKNNVQRGTDQRNVFSFLGSTCIRVVPVMPGAERAARAMEQPAMIGVFEGVAPDQADDEACQPLLPSNAGVHGKPRGR